MSNTKKIQVKISQLDREMFAAGADCWNEGCGKKFALSCQKCGLPLCLDCFNEKSCGICKMMTGVSVSPVTCGKCGKDVGSVDNLEFCFCGDVSKCEKCRNDHECILTKKSFQQELFPNENLPF